MTVSGQAFLDDLRDREEGRGSFIDIRSKTRCSYCNMPRATLQLATTGNYICEPCGDWHVERRKVLAFTELVRAGIASIPANTIDSHP